MINKEFAIEASKTKNVDVAVYDQETQQFLDGVIISYHDDTNEVEVMITYDGYKYGDNLDQKIYPLNHVYEGNVSELELSEEDSSIPAGLRESMPNDIIDE